MPSSYLASFRDLFNVAFVSCWSELHEELQNELVKHLEMALESQIPEITQTLLNLAEFMEHTEKVLHYLLWPLGWAFKAPLHGTVQILLKIAVLFTVQKVARFREYCVNE